MYIERELGADGVYLRTEWKFGQRCSCGLRDRFLTCKFKKKKHI